MNSTLYPWGACGNSCKDPDTGSPQTPAQYVKAWKHVHDIFIAEGATNVVWVWCPYGNAVSVNSFAPYYPGNDYVDWVAIDVYNWGSSSLYSLTKTSYDVLGSITGNSKPIMLAEFNSVNNESSGYRKAAWITAAFGNDIPSLPNIKAVVWFNHDYLSPGLRIETKPYDTYVVPAYKKAIASSYYLPNNSATVTPTPTPIPGDYTDVGDVPGDEVNIFDYNLVVSNFGNPYTIFDYNNVVQYFNL
jgi:beta-mannanase